MKNVILLFSIVICYSAFSQDTCRIHFSWNYPVINNPDSTIIIDVRPYQDCQKESCTIYIKPICPYSEFQVKFFNRWGEVLFESGNCEEGWYAYDQPDGIYIWQIEGVYVSGEKFKHRGHVTILH